MDQPAPTGFFARWHRMPLYLRIVVAMALGALAGVVFGARVEFLAIPSRLVLRVLGALAPVVILLAIVRALISATFEPRLFRLLLLNTLVAIFVGLLVANVVRP